MTISHKPITPKRPWPLLAGLALAVGSMYFLGNCTSKPSAEGSNDELEPIDVALEYAPGNFYRYDDTLGGLSYDLLNMIAEQHGMKFRFHPVSAPSKSLSDLDEGTIKLLVADVSATTELRGKYEFLEPVDIDRLVLVQRCDTSGGVAVKTQLDLGGDTVWTMSGRDIAERIANLSREIGDTIYTHVSDSYGSEQLFLMVALGEIDKAVVSERVAREMCQEYPEVDMSTEISFSRHRSWLTNKTDSLLTDSLNKWLCEIKQTALYDSLLVKYGRSRLPK